jgi:GcrA cell cycle regulator
MTLLDQIRSRPNNLQYRFSGHWSAERVDRLIELWDQGDFASVIARKINEETGSHFTRNAILGKVDRMHLPGRALKRLTPEERRDREKIRKRVKRAKERAPGEIVSRARARRAYLGEQVAVLDQQIPVVQRMTLFELNNHNCRWPVGDPQTREFFFCGAPEANLKDGRPYCPGHTYRALSVNANKLAA